MRTRGVSFYSMSLIANHSYDLHADVGGRPSTLRSYRACAPVKERSSRSRQPFFLVLPAERSPPTLIPALSRQADDGFHGAAGSRLRGVSCSSAGGTACLHQTKLQRLRASLFRAYSLGAWRSQPTDTEPDISVISTRDYLDLLQSISSHIRSI